LIKYSLNFPTPCQRDFWKIVKSQSISSYTFKDDFGKSLAFIIASVENSDNLHIFYDEVVTILNSYYKVLNKDKKQKDIGVSMANMFTCKKSTLEHVVMITRVIDMFPVTIIKIILGQVQEQINSGMALIYHYMGV
jgi:hypothetical protein